ncbi:MAG TPA: hypothetical protein VI583_14420 [Cyclobacteriaceae bacterium]|nr:hypothetical protein [Cyclobacteriaceae bacterium]
MKVFFFSACLAIIAFFIIPGEGLSQDSSFVKAEVFLINGNRISGRLLMNNQDSSVSIIPTGNMNINVPLNIIKSIIFYPEGAEPASRGSRVEYFNNTAFGFGMGKSSESGNAAATISAEMTHGISVRPCLQLGIGLGFEVYEMVSVMPYYISVSGDILKNKVTPHYYLQAGRSLAWENENYYYNYSSVKGKSLFSLGFGYKVYAGDRVNIGTSVYYKLQNVELINDNGFGTYRTERKYNRIGLKIHFGF